MTGAIEVINDTIAGKVEYGRCSFDGGYMTASCNGADDIDDAVRNGWNRGMTQRVPLWRRVHVT